MLNTLPSLPGVYIFKSHQGLVIYVGKAKNIKKRVSSYFKKQETDWKVQSLIREHASIEHIITKNETEALLLEAQLIKEFQPFYNTLLKSGDPFLYFVITDQDLPEFKLVRTKKLKGVYFGPFIHRQKARSIFTYLVNTFRLSLCSYKQPQGCLNYHLGRCAGTCLSTFNVSDYTTRLSMVKTLLEDNLEGCRTYIKIQIKECNTRLAFEQAQQLHTYLEQLETIFDTLKTGFSPHNYVNDIAYLYTPYISPTSLDHTLIELQQFLDLPTKPRIIDCFDISHFQSSFIVGSCIRFTNGTPDKNKFRRFKIKTIETQDDYAALREIVSRRYKSKDDLPDLIIIDGGKGQLNTVAPLIAPTICIGLAKKEETVFTLHNTTGMKLDPLSPTGLLLRSIRDYAHHFAISYHRLLRSKKLNH